MRPSWILSDKITNERVARVGYNHFISNKGKWNNFFSKFSNRVLPTIFISTILQSVRKENLAHYFPYDVKLGLLAHSRSFLANQKARNAIVGAENLLKTVDARKLKVCGLCFSQSQVLHRSLLQCYVPTKEFYQIKFGTNKVSVYALNFWGFLFVFQGRILTSNGLNRLYNDSFIQPIINSVPELYRSNSTE